MKILILSLLQLPMSNESVYSVLVKRIYNRIWSKISSDESVQKINDIGNFERVLQELKHRLKIKSFVTLFYKTECGQSLIDILHRISDIAHIGWITNQPIPFRTFHPDSTDLVSAIQSWLDEIAQE